jgi:betaine-aldehyde dehydrogenase
MVAAPAGEAEVTAAVAAARTAQPAWGGLTPAARSRRLLRFADAVEQRAADYVRAECAGTGKPPGEAAGEVEQSVDVLRFFAGAARAAQAPAGGELLPGRESWVRWEPLGVVAAVLPWNYPLLMAAWRLGPALAAGNTVVLKPAETTPDTALLLVEDAAATLGSDVVGVTAGDRETGRLLVAQRVEAVAFTGSHRAGLDVQSRAGLRALSLELGGNGPVIVLPDAPSYTYEALAAAVVYNAGQSCAAPARVITLPENYASTVEQLTEAMHRHRAGADFGPLNNYEQAIRYDSVLAASGAGDRRRGPLAVTEDERHGFWRPATVLADLEPDDPAITEEIFGPVLTVQFAQHIDDALRLANGVPQALAGSVWSTDVGAALRVAAGLDCGEAWVNCHMEQTAELPHGGRAASGHGTDLSTLALGEYRRPKTVTVRTR